MIEKYGCCVRVLGDLTLLPADVREAMEGAVAASRHKTRVTLNICMSYTHQREMTQAAEIVQGALAQGVIVEDDVDAALMQRALYTGISAALSSEAAAAAASTAAASSPAAAAASASNPDSIDLDDSDGAGCPWWVPSTPDLLIRTSGETRLSDFLCYQSSAGETQLAFTRTLWPDFSLLELGKLMLEFQRVAPALQMRRRERLRREQHERERSDRELVRRLIVAERRVAAQQQRECAQRRQAEAALLLYADGEGEDSEEERGAQDKATSVGNSGGGSVRSASAASLTTSEDSSSSGDDAEADAGLHTPVPSPRATSASSVAPTASAPATPLAYWRTGDVVESVLHSRRSTAAPSPSATPPPQCHVHSRCSDETSPFDVQHGEEERDWLRVDEAELQRRVRHYAAQRQQRLRAFTLFARKNTSSLL
jgi:undecaprenyl pyrophosphate synthase